MTDEFVAYKGIGPFFKSANNHIRHRMGRCFQGRRYYKHN